MTTAVENTLQHLAAGYDQVLEAPPGSGRLVGSRWGIWSSVEHYSPASPRQAAPPAELRIVLAEQLDVAGALALRAEAEDSAADTHAIVTEGIALAAVGVLETAGIPVTGVAEAGAHTMLAAADLEQALAHAHLLLAYRRPALPKKPAALSAAEWGNPVRAIRALSEDDFLQYYRDRAMAPVLGITRIHGRGVAVVGHQQLLGDRIAVEDIGPLARHLRMARTQGLPLLWLSPSRLPEPADELGADAVRMLHEELAAFGRSGASAVVVAEEADPVPAHLLAGLPGLSVLAAAQAEDGLRRWLDFAWRGRPPARRGGAG